MEERLEAGAVILDTFQKFREGPVRQEADILGEHAEEAAAKKFGDGVGIVTIGLKGFCKLGEVTGNLPSDFGGVARGIESEWIGPNEAKALACFLLAKIGKANAELARVGKGEVGFTRLSEISVDFEAFTHVSDNEEWGVGLVSRECADVALRLAASAGHCIVPLVGAASGCGAFARGEGTGGKGGDFNRREFGLWSLELFGFEDETGAFVEVDAAFGCGAVELVFDDGEFEGVTVVKMIMGTVDTEDIAKFGEERLAVRAF